MHRSHSTRAHRENKIISTELCEKREESPGRKNARRQPERECPRD